MAIKTFTTSEVLTAADTNTYLANSGLVFVKSQTIGSGVGSVTITDAFSATYDHYRISISNLVHTTGGQLKLTFGSLTTGYYYGTPLSATAGGAFNFNSAANTSYIDLGNIPATWNSDFTFDILAPFIATATKATGFGYVNSISFGGLGDGIQTSSTSVTTFTLTPTAGTLTSGTVTVYGYRKG
jgi:hypothetical protein